jgi:hypothetical protein
MNFYDLLFRDWIAGDGEKCGFIPSSSLDYPFILSYWFVTWIWISIVIDNYSEHSLIKLFFCISLLPNFSVLIEMSKKKNAILKLIIKLMSMNNQVRNNNLFFIHDNICFFLHHFFELLFFLQRFMNESIEYRCPFYCHCWLLYWISFFHYLRLLWSSSSNH